MPDPVSADWAALVRRHSTAAGYALSAAVIEELAAHLSEVYAEARDRGASEIAALAEAQEALARASYGDVAACQRAAPRHDSTLDAATASGGSWWRGIGADVRDAGRRLRQQPALSFAVAAILALGVGAATAAYAVIDAIVLRPLPYPASRQLVTVSQISPKGEGRSFATADWRDYQSRHGDVIDLAAFASWPMNITGGAGPERLRSVIVSGTFFRVAGRAAALGRVIDEADDDPAAARVAVLGNGFWRRRFGGAASVIGAEITVNGRPATIVGVMPPDFALPARDVDLWMPMALPASVLADRASEWVSLLGRVRSGADTRTLEAALGVTAQALEAAHPRTNAGERPHVRGLSDDLVRDVRRPLVLGAIAALLVLLTSCGNATHLVLLRAARRRDELAIRASLGAAPWRLRRQLLVESAVLTAIGGGLGVVAAATFLRGFAVLGAGRVPRLEDLPLAPAPLALAALGSVLVALVVAVASHGRIVRSATGVLTPAASRVVAGDEGHWLLAAQVAFALTLLSATAMVVAGYVSTTRVDPGFATADTLTMQLTLPQNRYPDSSAHAAFATRLSAELATLPGVTAVGIVSDLPFVANALHFRVRTEGMPPDSDQQVTVRPADAGFFRTLGIPVLEGRSFAGSDDAGAPLVAVLNRSAAERLQPSMRVGQSLQIGEEPPRTVVGIVGDIRHGGLHADEGPVVYVPYAQKTFGFLNWMGVVLRAPGAERLAPEVRRAVQRIDPDQPLQAVQTMADYVSRERAPFELSALVVGALGGAAVVLALAGTYGMTAFIVGRRTREIGVRIALGASHASIVSLVLRRAGLPVALGVVIGLAGSAAAAALLRSVVASAGAPPATPIAAVCAGILVLGAATAALRPALRAARIDPRATLSLS